MQTTGMQKTGGERLLAWGSVVLAALVAWLWVERARADEREDRLLTARRLIDHGQLDAAGRELSRLARQLGDHPSIAGEQDAVRALRRIFQWIEEGRRQEAMQVLAELARSPVERSIVHVLLARGHEASGQGERAEAEWQRVRELDPGSPLLPSRDRP